MADQIMAKGLEGVVVSQTGLSYIDGEAGTLLYRGYNIHDLAEHASYPEALYLLWNGELPTATELRDFEEELASQRALDDRVLEILRQLPEEANPMAALRTAVSAMGAHDPEGDDVSVEADRRKAARLVAKIPTALAAFHRMREGQDAVSPRQDLGHAANFLYMLHGEEPGEVAVDALDTSLLLYLDHGFNASTFTCRVIASTLSDLHSAVSGGVGALKGELHGGANEAAMRMLLEIGEPERAISWLEETLERGEKIMGFGHRVYRTEDPRATHLREMSRELTREAGMEEWFEISRTLEQEMLERKGINCNVDYYCATVYYALELPLDLYTPLFAMGRAGGWSAHVMEQHGDNRLIRPRAEYAGPEERSWVELERR
jgi:citrate synthase